MNEILKLIHTLHRDPDVPCVFVTSFWEEGVRIKGVASYIDELISDALFLEIGYNRGFYRWIDGTHRPPLPIKELYELWNTPLIGRIYP